jgi:hypothetical protein
MGEPNYKILGESLDAAAKEFSTFARLKVRDSSISMYSSECDALDMGLDILKPRNDYDLYLWLLPYDINQNLMLAAGSICDINS